MKVLRIETIEIIKIQTNVFVRKELDQDRVMNFADMICSGVKLPPIDVSIDYRMADGRHRMGGYQFLDITHVEVRVIQFESEEELISYAYKANAGGALPPTQADTEHTVQLFVERGIPVKRIAEYIGLPLELVKKYVTEVKSKIERVKLQKARVAVADGEMKVTEAAVHFGVDLDKLKALVSGERSKSKKKQKEIKGIITQLNIGHRSNGVKNGNVISKALEAYRDGDITSEDVEKLFSHVENHVKNQLRAVTDWRARFSQLKNGQEISIGK